MLHRGRSSRSRSDGAAARSLRGQDGYTIVEVLVAIMVFSAAVLGALDEAQRDGFTAAYTAEIARAYAIAKAEEQSSRCSQCSCCLPPC